MKHTLLVISLFASMGAQANLLDSGQISKAQYSVTLPFELVDNMMIVNLPIKGKDYRFMFDTGASNVFSEKAIKELGLKKRKDTMNFHDTSGEHRDTSLYDGPDLKIGDVSFKGFTFAGVDTLKDFPMSCFKLDGILGYNLLRHSAVSLDFQKKQITLSNVYKGNPVSEGYTPVGFYFYNNDAPQVAVFHKFGDLTLGIDTGKNDGITFRHPQLASVLNEMGYKPDSTYKMDMIGIYGLKTYDVNDYTLSGMRIGRMKINNEQVTVEAREGISLVGVSFLSNFKTIIDFPSRVVWFKSVARKEKSSSLPKFGFNLDIKNNGEMFASNVAEGKQAQKAGLKNGDQIVGINGSKHQTFTQDDFCDIYLNESSKIFIGNKEKVTLTVLRGGKSKDLSISYKK